jgi:hypothetical protein
MHGLQLVPMRHVRNGRSRCCPSTDPARLVKCTWFFGLKPLRADTILKCDRPGRAPLLAQDLEPPATCHAGDVNVCMDTHACPVESQVALQPQLALPCVEIAAREFESLGVKAHTKFGAPTGLGKPQHNVPELDALPQALQRVLARVDDLYTVIPFA